MSTGQSAVKRCGWGSKAGRLIPFVDKRVGGYLNYDSLNYVCGRFNTCHSERFKDKFRN